MKMPEVPGTEFEIKAELVLLAMGYVGPVHGGLLEQLGVAHDARGNVKADTDDYRDVGAQGLRGGRHAPRAVAGRLGDPRGPPVRAQRRRVPDGQLGPAALSRRSSPSISRLASGARRRRAGRRSAPLEEGRVLVLPHVLRAVRDGAPLPLAAWSDGRAKNISLDGAALKGARGQPPPSAPRSPR